MTEPLLLENEPLGPRTTLGVGGPARYLVEASTEADVLSGLEFAAERRLPVLILGGGSNLLISDAGFPGLVLRLDLRGVSEDPSDGTVVTASAGEEWDTFVGWCVERGLSGLECLSGIPGRVGATPIQNVGAYGQEVSETILSVRIMDRDTGEIAERGVRECRFGYRSSVFNTASRDQFVVLAVTFGLLSASRPSPKYPDLERYFAERAESPTLRRIRNAVLEIRATKGMVLHADDPESRSAGSFFKNPVLENPQADRAEERGRSSGAVAPAETMPRYAVAGAAVKIPAAWLIDHAGFRKGYTRGRAGISSRHSLALVNRGGATAAEVLDLAAEIRGGVEKVFGIGLTMEPVLVGF